VIVVRSDHEAAVAVQAMEYRLFHADETAAYRFRKVSEFIVRNYVKGNAGKGLGE
jgi:hypothetical protein